VCARSEQKSFRKKVLFFSRSEKGREPWFSGVQKGGNGATAPGIRIQGMGHPKSEITKIKMLWLDDFSYCKSTNTCCMDLIFQNFVFCQH